MPNQTILNFFAFTLFVSLIGCGGPSIDTAPVSGIVTLDGKPVADAGIYFQPADGGPAAYGSTDAEGHYSLTTVRTPGALKGSHKVIISKIEVLGIASEEDGLSGLVEPGGLIEKYHIPPVYGTFQTSKLTAEVPAENDEVDFALTTEEE